MTVAPEPHQRRFRLLRYFSTTSALVFVLMTLLLGAFYGHSARHDLIALGEQNNIALTQAFANSIWPQFAPFLTSASTLNTEQLRTAPKTAQLRRAVLDLMQKLPVVKVKIYTLDGRTVFSTQASQVGQDKSTNAGFLAARTGQVASELTHRDTFSAFEQTIEDRDVLSSYLPIQRGTTTNPIASPIEGVFEIYADVTPLLLKVEQRQQYMVFGVILGLTFLYAILFVIVRRADTTIKSQHTALATEIVARQQAEEAVRQQNATLETAVQERTAQLEIAKEAAEASSLAKSEFLANMSHELRTPLHSILSFGDLGLEKVEAAPAIKLRRYFEQIIDGGQTLIGLVDNVLDLSKMDAGKMEFAFEVGDLRDLLAAVVDEFSSLISDRQISISLLPVNNSAEVMVDHAKIKQVVRNLLSNAVKFSPDGSIVELSLHLDSDVVTVQVRDQGPGIPATELETIFDKFMQSSRTKTGAGGTGLGLAICRELLIAHNGDIWAENTTDGGALFTFVLPRQGCGTLSDSASTRPKSLKTDI